MLTTEQQLKIIEHGGNCFVLASAGSGKTFTVIEKIKYIKSRDPDARILYITFTRKAKLHAKQKIGVMPNVNVHNFHGLAYSVLVAHTHILGITEVDIVPDSYCLKVLSDAYPGDNKCELRRKLLAVRMAKVNCIPISDMSLGLKSVYTVLTNALESCKKFTYVDLLVKFNEMMVSRVLRENYLSGILKYDYIMCDEVNDNNKIQFSIIESLMSLNPATELTFVGDLMQCVSGDTDIGGTKAKDLVPGKSRIPTYCNGKVVSKAVDHVSISDWKHGYRIVTESGKTLTVSPNHKLYVTLPEIPMDQWVVYLMYRPNYGFRIGVVSRTSRDSNSLVTRANHDKAERVWVLKLCKSKAQALYYENKWSLKYSITQAPSQHENRHMDSNTYAKIFKEFGHNGYTLLNDFNMSFTYSNYTSSSVTPDSKSDKHYRICIAAHGLKGTCVSMEFVENKCLIAYLRGKVNLTYDEATGRFRFRKWFYSYKLAFNFGVKLVDEAPNAITIRERLCVKGVNRNRPTLVYASNVTPYMKVPVKQGDSVVLETITAVEEVADDFYSVTIEDTQNFFGNDVLSHNTMYTWRGSRPDLCAGFMEKHNMTLFPLTKNFRSQKSIIDLGNKVLDLMDAYTDFRFYMNSHRERGDNIEFFQSDDPVEGFNKICTYINRLVNTEGYKYSDFNVLFRVNRIGTLFEREAHRHHIPFRLVKGNLFDRKTIAHMVNLIKVAHHLSVNSSDKELNVFLREIAMELSPDIGRKTYDLVYKHKPDVPLMIKLSNIQQYTIKGLGPIKQMAFKTFYGILQGIMATYKELKDRPIDLLEEYTKLIMEFKYYNKLDLKGSLSAGEDLSEFSELISELKGSIMQRLGVLLTEFSGFDEESPDEENVVLGLTVHSAKGTEAPIIIIADAHNFPLEFTIGKPEEEEEKRILYVAVTRAKDKLFFNSIGPFRYGSLIFNDFDYCNKKVGTQAMFPPYFRKEKHY